MILKTLDEIKDVLFELDKSKVYLVRVPAEAIISGEQRIEDFINIFYTYGIDVIVIPEEIQIYELTKTISNSDININ